MPRTALKDIIGKKVEEAMLTKSVDEKKRQITVTMTTDKPDRDGDIVEPSGLDFTHFEKNPVVQWAHDLTKPPIGKVIKIMQKKRTADAVVQFADTEFAHEVFGLYAEGYLNAWSLGFLPKKGMVNYIDATAGLHFIEAEVVELSAVPVPANPDALSKALYDKQISSEVRKALEEHMPEKDESEESEAEEQPEETLEPEVEVKTFKASVLDIPVEAFTKTFADRANGRFPIKFIEHGEDGPSVLVEYEPVRKEGERLCEAKLKSVTLAVLAPAARAPEGRDGSQEGDNAEDNAWSQINALDLHRVTFDVEAAEASLAMFDAQLLELST